MHNRNVKDRRCVVAGWSDARKFCIRGPSACRGVTHAKGEILLTAEGVAARVNVLNREGDDRAPKITLSHKGLTLHHVHKLWLWWRCVIIMRQAYVT
jgi:hypothetical protein